MPDPNDAFSTLDDFLLSLADGVTQAQNELARAGAVGPAGAQFTYHLPRVDFEFKLNLRIVEDSGLSNKYQSIRPARIGDRHLMFRPITPGVATGSSNSTLEIAATLSGALVAVPANEGLPATVLNVSVDDSEELLLQIRVEARNTARERLVGLPVEFNIDREETLALASSGSMSIAANTVFETRRVLTDADGVAIGRLRIAENQMPGWLALVVDAASQTQQMVYEVRS